MNIDCVTREQVVNRTGEHVMTGHQRPGQAFFNALAELMPEVAEAIRGTDIDPFHESADAGGAKFKLAAAAMDAALAAQPPRRMSAPVVPDSPGWWLRVTTGANAVHEYVESVWANESRLFFTCDCMVPRVQAVEEHVWVGRMVMEKVTES